MESITIISRSEIDEIKNTQNLILQKINNLNNSTDDELMTVKEAANFTKLSELKLDK